MQSLCPFWCGWYMGKAEGVAYDTTWSLNGGCMIDLELAMKGILSFRFLNSIFQTG